jgi:hypothetical protein
MERSIRTRRVYNLEDIVGRFNTFETEEIISAIPEHLVFDTEFIGKVKTLQLLELDLQYYKYAELIKTLLSLPEDERIAYLREQKAIKLEELNKYLFNTIKEETK